MREVPRQSRRSILGMLASAGLAVACRTAPRGHDEFSLDATGEQYVRLTLQLAQHQPSLVEAWLGPSAWRPEARRPVAAIRAEIAPLQHAIDAAATSEVPRDEDAATNGATSRLTYLQRQIAALDLAARRLSGESMTFFDEARGAFGGRAAALLADAKDSTERLAAGRAELDRRLPGRGPLHERYAAFRKAYAIAPERVAATLQGALEYCRARVRAELSLPDEESVQLEPARGLGLEGLATYEGHFRSRVRIDASGPIDLARAVWLVAHETYPGHHLQHVLCDSDLVIARGWSERALYPAFGSHLLVAEGAAEAGAALLLADSHFNHACRAIAHTAGTPVGIVEDLVAVQRAVADLDLTIAGVAQAYVDHTIDAAAAAEALTTDALVPDARPLLALIERQRTRVLSYPIGRRLVSTHLSKTPPDRRWPLLARIASTLVLPS